MVMSLEATSSAEGGRDRAVRLHVWIGVSPTLGVVHSHLSVAGVRCFFVSHISVCSGYGGKPARQFVIVNDTGTEFVLQVTDNCGKVQCKLAKGWMDMRLLECNTKWIVVGCQDHMEVMRINPHCWMVPPCGNEEVILSRLEDNTCCGPVSVPYREGVWYMQGIFNVEKEDEILLVDGSTHGSSCLVDLNATFKTKSLVVIYYTWIPSASKGSVVLKGTIHTISPQVPPASFKLYNTETKAHIHTFPEGSTIAAVGPDCICETTTTGTHNIFHVTSLDTPLHSLANTTILTTDPLSGVLATTTKTHSSKTTAAPVLTVTFLDALTRTVLAAAVNNFSENRTPLNLTVLLDAKSQFVALACTASPVNSIQNRDDVTTTLRRSRSKNNIRAGRCDAHVVAVVGSLMRHLCENHVVRAHRHMAVSLDATPSGEEKGKTGNEVGLHVWIGVSLTLGVVHSQVLVTGPEFSLLSHVDVCCDGGKEERWFIFDEFSAADCVLRVLDGCGKAQGMVLCMASSDVRFLDYNTEWIVIGFSDHIKILKTHAHRWVSSKNSKQGFETV
ncbi:hypothetical protein Pelo_4807 [Pelomyxa schiedti]|nr:hypothetical protein Pelo_4807 [Pelomyxa schiedti]